MSSSAIARYLFLCFRLPLLLLPTSSSAAAGCLFLCCRLPLPLLPPASSAAPVCLCRRFRLPLPLLPLRVWQCCLPAVSCLWLQGWNAAETAWRAWWFLLAVCLVCLSLSAAFLLRGCIVVNGLCCLSVCVQSYGCPVAF